MLYPEVADRDCQHCAAFVYDEKTGRPIGGPNGEPLRRPAGMRPPCRTSRGCPKGTPEVSHALTDANVLIWIFHEQCRAVGRFPDDPLVAENAQVIEAAREFANEVKSERDRKSARWAKR